jgi:nucleoside-diphosphate-sugar epimerase
MTERILVTGGAGYLGSVLCEHLLDAGYHLTVVDNLIYGQEPLFHLCAHERFEFVRGDVRDERLMHELISRADVLVPLAAVVGAPACDRDPWLAKAVNRDAVALLNRLRSPNQLVVFPMTNSGYGTQTGEVHCTEETPLEPISHYGRTKAQAETELLSSQNAITLRLATVFGMSPRMRLDLLVNHFTYAAVTDRYLVLFERHHRRNFVHIRDVAGCFLHAIAHRQQMAGRPYNVGLDRANLSKEGLARKIAEHVPGFVIHCSEIGADPDKRDYVVSNQRLREAGFEASRSLDDGIRELIKGYRMLARGRYLNV